MKKIRSCIVMGVLVLGSYATLHADSVADKIGITGIAAAAFPVGDQSVMDHTASVGHDFGGIFRVGVTPKWSVGASYDNINLYGEDGERHHPETLLADVFYHLSPEKKLVPTLQLGLGVGSTLTDGSLDKFSLRTGLGLDYFFCPNFSAGPQLTYTYITNSSGGADEYHIFGAGLMVSLFFDKPSDKAAPAEASNPPPAAAVAPAAVVAAPVEKKVTIDLHILFDSGKSAIKPEYRSHIEEVANFMNTYSQSTAEIEGHSDDTGGPDMNKRLSQKRADAVRDYLIKEFHIDPSRITAMGYGEEGPLADNSTPEGREKNRRVVATLEAVKLVHPNQ